MMERTRFEVSENLVGNAAVSGILCRGRQNRFVAGP